MNLDLPALAARAAEHLSRPLFLTVSGSHLYGFPSEDSDVDLRGAFLAPLDQIAGLIRGPDTVERKLGHAGVEVELVAHESAKYLHLLTKDNGYILEQVFSPLVVTGAEFLARLRPLAAACVTRGCYRHYRGFYQSQLRLLEREEPKRAKSLLYAYRVLLTGIHLLRTGTVEANILVLNRTFGLPFIGSLIERKRSRERAELTGLDWAWHKVELERWEAELDAAYAASTLPEAAPREPLHRFLVALRMEEVGRGPR